MSDRQAQGRSPGMAPPGVWSSGCQSAWHRAIKANAMRSLSERPHPGQRQP